MEKLRQEKLRRWWNAWSGIRLRTRFLLGLWLFFFLLVAAGIHGSSIPLAATWWSPETPYSGYLLDFLPRPGNGLPVSWPKRLNSLAMADPRAIRSDEWLVTTDYALAQLTHTPPFPIVNSNIGDGENMLVWTEAPVWHLAALAKPSTWGYFLFGAQRGLAWHWWFPVFACFTVLCLLLEIILQGHADLAAFGAFWFCSSAYVVCWSQWPAQFIFFAALACLATYHLLTSDRRGVQWMNSVLLGVSLSGFVMQTYPPWQVMVGYLFLLVFAGLWRRDRLYNSLKAGWRSKLFLLGFALLIAAALLGAYFFSALPALKLMAATVYPGKRVSTGGHYPPGVIFKGFYNWITVYSTAGLFGNQSESASFFHLFPGIFLALLLSGKLRRLIGPVGSLMVFFLVGILFFDLAGIPLVLAKATLMSYVMPARADLSMGVASIILALLVLVAARQAILDWQDMARVGIAGILSGLFFLYCGFSIRDASKGFPEPRAILLVSVLGAGLSVALLAGWKKIFCGVLALCLLITSITFNPLATNLDFLYNSPLSREIVALNRESGDHPLWICYGDRYSGVLVSLLGGRSIFGIQWPPFMSVWQALDPTGEHQQEYNRLAHVRLVYEPDPAKVSFQTPQADVLVVAISPENPVFKSRGARYIVADGESRKNFDGNPRYPLIFQTQDFSIYSIPQ